MLERIGNRILPGSPAGDQVESGQPGQSILRKGFGTRRNGHHHPRRARSKQCLDRMPNDGLPAPKCELLGYRLPCAKTLAGCHHDGCKGGEGGSL